MSNDPLTRAHQEIERLRAERNEARREVCHAVFVNGGIRPGEYAKHRGWDCFSQESGK